MGEREETEMDEKTAYEAAAAAHEAAGLILEEKRMAFEARLRAELAGVQALQSGLAQKPGCGPAGMARRRRYRRLKDGGYADRILSFIRAHGPLRLMNIAAGTFVPVTSCSGPLTILLRRGDIKRVGRGVYQATDQNGGE